MKQAILTFGLIILGQLSFSQLDSSKQKEPGIFYYCNEIPAKYPGGHGAMVKLFAHSMKYPVKAGREGTGGKVVVAYKVDTFGITTGITIFKGVREDLDQEAIRLIRLLKRWTPATLNGKKINYYNNQPFIFIPVK